MDDYENPLVRALGKVMDVAFSPARGLTTLVSSGNPLQAIESVFEPEKATTTADLLVRAGMGDTPGQVDASDAIGFLLDSLIAGPSWGLGWKGAKKLPGALKQAMSAVEREALTPALASTAERSVLSESPAAKTLLEELTGPQISKMFSGSEIQSLTGRPAVTRRFVELAENRDKWLATLSPEERAALLMQTSGPQRLIQAATRGSTAGTLSGTTPMVDGMIPLTTVDAVKQEVIPYLDAALSKAPRYPADTVTYRVAPIFGGGHGSFHILPSNYEDMVGKTVADLGYLPTSSSPRVGSIFPNQFGPNEPLYQIIIPKGEPYPFLGGPGKRYTRLGSEAFGDPLIPHQGRTGYVTAFPEEMEATLPRGMSFKVLAARPQKNVRINDSGLTLRLNAQGLPIPSRRLEDSYLQNKIFTDTFLDSLRARRAMSAMAGTPSYADFLEGVGDYATDPSVLRPNWRSNVTERPPQPNLLLQAIRNPHSSLPMDAARRWLTPQEQLQRLRFIVDTSSTNKSLAKQMLDLEFAPMVAKENALPYAAAKQFQTVFGVDAPSVLHSIDATPRPMLELLNANNLPHVRGEVERIMSLPQTTAFDARKFAREVLGKDVTGPNKPAIVKAILDVMDASAKPW